MASDEKRKLRVLIVENNPVDTKMLTGLLTKSLYGAFEYQTADSLDVAFQNLAKNIYDVCLLDLNLKDSRGMDTLQVMNKKYPQLPIVVNTGAYQDDVGLKAVTRGAQDYLIKGKYEAYGLGKSLYYAVERKRAEIELQTAYERLKDTQAQLIQAEKMNVVGGLASGVAHEVKNPLATILYGIEFLNTKLEQRDEQIELTIRSIKEATQRANEIIKDLLDFSSLSNLKITLEDIHRIVDQALVLTHHQCEKNNISVVRHFAPELPPIGVDRNRVEQVFVDVIINAILAMKGTGGVLSVSTYLQTLAEDDLRRASQPEGQLRVGQKVIVVDVDDAGPGVRPEDLSKVFDPFFTTRRAAGGVGLGLSIARTIMNNHSGSITLMNLAQGGARARLIFCVS